MKGWLQRLTKDKTLAYLVNGKNYESYKIASKSFFIFSESLERNRNVDRRVDLAGWEFATFKFEIFAPKLRDIGKGVTVFAPQLSTNSSYLGSLGGETKHNSNGVVAESPKEPR